MKANFLKLREIMHTEFPEQWSTIQGANYPVPEWVSYASTVISFIQIFAMLLIMIGDSLWTYVPGLNRPPEFYYKMKENPALTFIIVFLIIPSYVQSFANSGAFELYVDNKLIYSKLETGRMPQVDEIIRSLESIGMKRR